MSILINEHTRVLVQGITGKEGGRAAKEMASYGTVVCAGVTPGKGGTITEEGVPIFESVAEAMKAFPEINTALIVIPGKFVGVATEESLNAGIPLVNILSERVPMRDVAHMIAVARAKGATIIGPSSVGVITPGKVKLGSIGSGGLAARVFAPGNVGVISKSGGMTSEISRILTEAGIGQSTALGIGGDPLIGADFLDIALLFEKDQETNAIVIFGEVGGIYENQLAQAIKDKKVGKPVVALIAGVFAETLPSGTLLGHAGAIVEGERNKASVKIKELRAAGAYVAETPEEIVVILRKLVGSK